MGMKYRHLDLEERVMIQMYLRSGMSPAAIGRELGRSRSTIIREMCRNGGKLAGVGYDGRKAQRRAERLRRKPRVARRLQAGTDLWKKVFELLKEGLSPAQISRTLERMKEPVRLSHETIYTTLYAMPRGELRSQILKLTRRKHHVRRPRRGNRGAVKPPIPDMTLIDQRPKEVEERWLPGHWEADLIIGKGNLSQVGVLVERCTLFTVVIKLKSSRAEEVAKAFSKRLKGIDRQMRLSMTFDQGSEMRQHKKISQATGIKFYFAHPHSPWERGICENTNGLLRQYLPKGTDLSIYSQKQLDQIAWKLNTRPRKTLGWHAPAELYLPEGAFDFVKYWSAKVA
jgi:IS30 family transposase